MLTDPSLGSSPVWSNRAEERRDLVCPKVHVARLNHEMNVWYRDDKVVIECEGRLRFEKGRLLPPLTVVPTWKLYWICMSDVLDSKCHQEDSWLLAL